MLTWGQFGYILEATLTLTIIQTSLQYSKLRYSLSQGSLLMTRAQDRWSSWRQPAPWGTSTASPTPTLRLSSRATTLTESKSTRADTRQNYSIPHTFDITSVAADGAARLQWHFLFGFAGELSCSAHHDSAASLKTAPWNTARTNTPATKSRGSSRTTCECCINPCLIISHPYAEMMQSLSSHSVSRKIIPTGDRKFHKTHIFRKDQWVWSCSHAFSCYCFYSFPLFASMLC